MGGTILGALLEYLSKKFKRKRLNYRCWQKNIQLLFFNRSTLVIHVWLIINLSLGSASAFVS